MKVTPTKKLAGYTAWNFLGMSLPMFAAIFAIPLLIQHMGKERFGLLTLIWMLVGYLGVFDLGMGRALTRMTAERLGRGKKDEIIPLFWTSLTFMLAIGCLAGTFVIFAAPWLAQSVLKVPVALQPEIQRSFFVVAWSLPIIVSTVAMIGFLEAHNRFFLINALRFPMGVYTFVGPLCVLPFTNNLIVIVSVLIAGRTIECLLYFGACAQMYHWKLLRPTFRKTEILPLLTFGGWATISNILLPLMLQINRFLIGAFLSVAMIAYYVTPAEIVVKLLIVTRSFSSVLLPQFAANFENNAKETAELFGRSVMYLICLLFPIVLTLCIFAQVGLRIWLGSDFSQHSTLIIQILAVAMFIYSLGYIPFSLLQGVNRPDIPAKIHLVELPVYMGLSWLLITTYGIVGAAAALLIRVCFDVTLMFIFAQISIKPPKSYAYRVAGATVLCVALLGLQIILPTLMLRTLAGAISFAFFAILAWFCLLHAKDKQLVLRILTTARQRLSVIARPS